MTVAVADCEAHGAGAGEAVTSDKRIPLSFETTTGIEAVSSLL